MMSISDPDMLWLVWYNSSTSGNLEGCFTDPKLTLGQATKFKVSAETENAPQKEVL